MPNNEELTRDLTATQNDIKRLQQHEAWLREQLGESASGTVEDQHQKAVSDAELFEALGPVGQAQLARENPERLTQLAEAYRIEGERRLFNKGPIP